MEGRMTLCNMSIEAGARAGMVAPDETTFDYLKGRRFAPRTASWETALAWWRTLPTDPDAALIDWWRSTEPSWLPLSPGEPAPAWWPVTDRVPEPLPARPKADAMAARMLEYMGLKPGTRWSTN